MPTLTEIAKLAGVSPAVVSRVVNKDLSLRISKETLERVEAVVRDSGYTANRAARSLRSTKSGLIALVVHDVTNPVYGEITKGANAAASAAGKAILISDASGGDEGTARLMELVSGQGVDGLLLQAGRSLSDQVLARAARENVPTILLQTVIGNSISTVVLPDEEAARIGVQHLVDQGYQKIGCIATAKGLSFTESRVKGWKACLAENNFECDDNLIRYGTPTIEDGRQAMQALLSANPDISAVLCCNVVAGLGAMSVLRDQGLRIPVDCAVVAIHDIPMADFVFVPITTVEMPLFKLGQIAVENLLKPNSQATPGPICVPSSPRLIRRAST